MKKITALFLVISLIACMAITFTGCEKTSGYETFMSALTKTNEIKTYDCDMDMKVSVSMTGFSMDITMNGNAKVDINVADNPKMNMDMNMGFMGQTISMKSYYADGFSYIDSMDQKIKAALTAEDLKSESPVDLLNFKEEDIIEATIKNEDKVSIYTVKISGEKVKEILLEQLDGIKNILGGEVGDVTFSDVEATFKIKDGYIIEQGIKFDLTSKIETPDLETSSTISTDSTMKFDITIKINNPGTAVTVTAPSDLSEYKTMEELYGDIDFEAGI